MTQDARPAIHWRPCGVGRAGHMEETIGKAKLRDAAIGTGIRCGQDMSGGSCCRRLTLMVKCRDGLGQRKRLRSRERILLAYAYAFALRS
jgi:hypothetical protein